MYSVVYLSIRHAVSELRGELGGKRSLFQGRQAWESSARIRKQIF